MVKAINKNVPAQGLPQTTPSLRQVFFLNGQFSLEQGNGFALNEARAIELLKKYDHTGFRFPEIYEALGIAPQ